MRNLLGVVCVLAALSAGAQPKPIVTLDFEEGAGGYADDAAGGLCAELTPSAKWANGAFGGALATGGKEACAVVRRVSGLDSAQGCSFFLRFRKEGASYGKYPCILSSSGWESGGMLLFSDGKSLNLRLRAGSDGPEGSWPVYKSIPEGKWCSVAMVFGKGEVVVYADGKEVAKGKWKHPLVVRDLELGGWHGASFGGFIDDFRIWRGRLDARAIAELASDSRYAEIEGYQDDGTGGIQKTQVSGQAGRPFKKFENSAVELVFDTLGCVSSLREKASGRELVANVTAFATAKLKDGRTVAPRRIEERKNGEFAWIFAGGLGEVVMAVEPFDGGWTFRVKSSTLKDVVKFEFCRIEPVCAKWNGRFANAWSDEASGVCVRSYDLCGNPLSVNRLHVEVTEPFGIVGRAAGLVAGPRAGLREQLKSLTIASGAPRSDSGGAWAMESEVARWSYVFAPVWGGDIDYWIEFVKRAGFSLIHLNSSWTDCLGHCPVNRRAFPGGLDEMKACAEKAHAAGLRMGMHTLTACINPNDPWITPVCREDLVADATYTLAAPLAEDATELLVNEKPIDKHVTVFTYSSNGNVIRIGNELMQYTGIRRDKAPYAFTGLKRGAFRTKKGGTYPAGTKADYLHQRYIAFYPKPDSKLADELSDRLAEVYNTCNLDEFYFDGSEGMGTRYGIDSMRHQIYRKLKANNGHSPSIEASCAGANNWWFQTRTATTDHGVYGVKRFHDWHIDWAVNLGRNANFLEPQMGWWQPRLDVPRARGHMLDEMEYFGAKNAGHDAPMSIQGVGFRPLAIGVRRQMTVLGWYEYPRLARAFAPEVKAYLAAPETEARLRQDDKGVWQLTDVVCHTHRVALPWLGEWKVKSDIACPAALRVEALYAAGKDGEVVLGAEDFGKMKVESAKGVSAKFESAVKTEKGSAMRFTAANNNASQQNAAWAETRYSFDFPGKKLGKNKLAFGAWVKGDGSGALLNFQFTTPPAYHGCRCDHYVRLDFKGWRYVTVLARERDSAEYHKYKWPYGGYAAIYRTMLNPEHLGTVSVFLNDIPKGSQASVEIGEMKAFEMETAAVKAAAVEVNGEVYTVPFALASGEYAELDGGSWTHFSAKGEALRRLPAAKMPRLNKGDNALKCRNAATERVEVTLFALGAERPAFVKKLSADMRKVMRYEGVMPFEYAPELGLHAPAKIPVRPGEKAKLSVELYGPAKNPVFTFKRYFGLGKTVCSFNTEIGKDERLVCRDGRTWKVEVCANGKVLREGTLEKPLPLLRGTSSFTFAAEVPQGQSCSVDLLKTY